MHNSYLVVFIGGVIMEKDDAFAVQAPVVSLPLLGVICQQSYVNKKPMYQLVRKRGEKRCMKKRISWKYSYLKLSNQDDMTNEKRSRVNSNH